MTEALLGLAVFGFLVYLLITYIPMPDPMKIALVVIAVIYVVLRFLPRLGIVLPVLALVVLTGCAGLSLPADPTKMTAEQLKEWVKDRSGNIQCGHTETPYKFGLTSVNLDKGIIINGTITVEDNCKITISNTTTGPAAPPRP